jgi:hypothetical protein
MSLKGEKTSNNENSNEHHHHEQHASVEKVKEIACVVVTDGDFLVVEWRINKLYNIVQNLKHVKLNDFVTCKVNDVRDTGRVVFVGNESECKARLAKLRKIQAKKRRKKLNLCGSKLNLPEANSYATTTKSLSRRPSINLKVNEPPNLK